MKMIFGLRSLFVAGLFVLAAGGAVATDTKPSGKRPPSMAEQTLYKFCSQSNCTDGSGPSAGLIVDMAGNLYGTTRDGGGHNQGTVFNLAPIGTRWNETVLYDFCSQDYCTDGA